MSELTSILSEAFDVASEDGTPAFEPIPAGTYVAAIKDIKAGPLKSGKGEAVMVTWEIEDDKYCGRLVWDRMILKHESIKAMELGRKKFKDLAEACGMKDAFTDLDLLQGKHCLIFVKIETDPNGDYPPRNKVVRVRPMAAETSRTNGKVEFDDKIPF
jgi:hypothetical protein